MSRFVAAWSASRRPWPVARDSRLLGLARGVSDGRAIDWPRAELAARDPEEQAYIRQLRIVSRVRASAPAAVGDSNRILLSACAAILAVAGLKITTALISCVTAWATTGDRSLFSPHAAAVLVFGVPGAILLSSGRRDQRAVCLGALFLLIGSAFTDRLLLPLLSGPVAVRAFGAALRSLGPDAFLAPALWVFMWLFPQPPRTTGLARRGARDRDLRRPARALFVGNAVLAPPPVSTRRSDAACCITDRYAPRNGYWPVLFVLAAPRFPTWWKRAPHRASSGRGRRCSSARWSSASMPMLAAVLISVRAVFRRRGAPAWLGTISFLAGAAVAIDRLLGARHRVVDIRLVLRTLQHSLAKYRVALSDAADLIAGYLYESGSDPIVSPSRIQDRAIGLVFMARPRAGRPRAGAGVARSGLPDGKPDPRVALARLDRRLRRRAHRRHAAARSARPEHVPSNEGGGLARRYRRRRPDADGRPQRPADARLDARTDADERGRRMPLEFRVSRIIRAAAAARRPPLDWRQRAVVVRSARQLRRQTDGGRRARIAASGATVRRRDLQFRGDGGRLCSDARKPVAARSATAGPRAPGAADRVDRLGAGAGGAVPAVSHGLGVAYRDMSLRRRHRPVSIAAPAPRQIPRRAGRRARRDGRGVSRHGCGARSRRRDQDTAEPHTRSRVAPAPRSQSHGVGTASAPGADLRVRHLARHAGADRRAPRRRHAGRSPARRSAADAEAVGISLVLARRALDVVHRAGIPIATSNRATSA